MMLLSNSPRQIVTLCTVTSTRARNRDYYKCTSAVAIVTTRGAAISSDKKYANRFASIRERCKQKRSFALNINSKISFFTK